VAQLSAQLVYPSPEILRPRAGSPLQFLEAWAHHLLGSLAEVDGAVHEA
jgi:hypothetical protein